MSDASPTPLPRVENVSDAQAYNQILRDFALGHLDSVADEVGRSVRRSNDDLDELQDQVRRAQYELMVVEAMLATRMEVDDE